MLGRTPGNIVAIRPLRDGVISDYDITEKMLKHFIGKVCGNKAFRFFKPRIVVCVPSGVTEVEKRAVREAAIESPQCFRKDSEPTSDRATNSSGAFTSSTTSSALSRLCA